MASLLLIWRQIQRASQAAKARLALLVKQYRWISSPWTEAAGLLLLALSLNLIGNDRTSLWDRDEPRYAQCAREMRASGDYLHPSFNGEPRYQKPILSYWLMQVGVFVGGDNPFGNRLMSACFGAGSCVLVWRLGRRMFGDSAGRIAGFAMASAPLVIIESKLATTDASLCFFLTLSYAAGWELTQRASRGWAATLWVSLALAILTKGPVAPAFLVSSAVCSWLWCGRPALAWDRLNLRWGLSLLVLLVAPWYLTIAWLSRGDFYRVAVGQQLVNRALEQLESHGGFPGYYVLTTFLSFFPWSVFLPLGLRLLWQQRKLNRSFGYLAGWVLGPLPILELFHTKLIHYYLPAIGGCALVVGWALEQVASSELNLRRWRFGRLALGLLMGIGSVVAVTLLAAVFIAPSELRLPMIVVAVIIAATVLVSAEELRRAATRRAWPILVGGTACAFLLLTGWLLPNLEHRRLTPQVAARLAEVCRETSAQPMLWTFQPPGLVYEFGSPIPIRRDIPWMDRLVHETGAVVAPLLDWEIEALKKDPRLTLERHGEVTGLNIERGKTQTVELVVIRPAPASLLGRPSVDVAIGQKPLIK